MTSRSDDETSVDAQLRSDIFASLATFRVPASEPMWSEWAEPTGAGAQLVLYITNRKDHFGTLGGFWIHALFDFLEDRLESSVLAECATTQRQPWYQRFGAHERRNRSGEAVAEREPAGDWRLSGDRIR